MSQRNQATYIQYNYVHIEIINYEAVSIVPVHTYYLTRMTATEVRYRNDR